MPTLSRLLLISALALPLAVGCATEKPKPTREQVQKRPAVVLAEVELTGSNADAAGDLKARFRGILREKLASEGLNVVDDAPGLQKAAELVVKINVTYYGMDGVSSQAVLDVKKGANVAATFEHLTGTNPREGEGKQNFTLEPSTAEYAQHVAEALAAKLLASTQGEALTQD
jgi:hypothetical protein